ncbi:aminomethyltransferase [Desulfohalotomaculum tongense]|uniref:glycine cleavage system aminomethyltransferase GcvT n=1 Tax=Desulforadius tongensis TaxID=1216062 RepID=UPI0019570631|nr:glycine cleavage system aminomethyltransferase GcvT [Desulforadius tongensis]MBM7855250.1 aminomethyltransferase [Desulforadius tongensis]
MDNLKRTPLYEVHLELKAKMVPFGGWEMPVQYGGIIKEHKAVRERAGLFDVSHMGELLLEGPEALAALQKLVTNDVSKIGIGRAMYTPMINEDGGTVDDLLIYNLGLNRYLLVVNASNKDKDLAWIKEHLTGEVDVVDKSHDYALLALQGPLSQQVLQSLTSLDLKEIKYYHFAMGAVAEVPCLVSRTGYTGEDGFELYCHPEEAEKLWRAILDTGRRHGVVPVGLGARDTLRFEACLALYGHELTEDINPLMAGLGWTVKFDKGEFIGKQALLSIKEKGVSHKLVGLKMIERGVPREGYAVAVDGQQVGWVTTGSYAPTLNANLALAYVKPEYAGNDTELDIIIRGRELKAQVVPKPFYKRNK